MSNRTRLTQPPRPHLPHHHPFNATVTVTTMDILLEKYKTLLNYCPHRPTVVHTSPAGVYHHFINTYKCISSWQTKSSPRSESGTRRMACQQQGTAARANAGMHCMILNTTVYMWLCTSVVIYNVHGQVMGIFAWQAPLNTLTGHSRKNQHLKVLIWGGGRGGLRISTLY